MAELESGELLFLAEGDALDEAAEDPHDDERWMRFEAIESSEAFVVKLKGVHLEQDLGNVREAVRVTVGATSPKLNTASTAASTSAPSWTDL